MARQTKKASPRPRPRFLPRVDEVLCDCLGAGEAVGDDDDVGGIGEGFMVVSERLLVSILSLDLFCTDQQTRPSIAGTEML